MSDPQVTLIPSGGAATAGPLIADWWFQLHNRIWRPLGPDTPWSFPATLPADPVEAAALIASLEDFDYSNTSTYLPMPQPSAAYGAGFTGWTSWVVVRSTQKVADSGAPVGLLMRTRNSPFPYYNTPPQTTTSDANALQDALDNLERLDFVFMDLEFEVAGILENVAAIISTIRNHPNPLINQAYLGNYEDYPGATDPAAVWPFSRDRTAAIEGGDPMDRVALYATGLNVAMPSLYPYEVYSHHTNATHQLTGDTSPNTRAASLWAPLARLSVAKQNLPAGHMLVPWVGNYAEFMQADPNGWYTAPPPPIADLDAMIRHIRLRGADGFLVWVSDMGQTVHTSVSYTQYRDLALAAWRSLDGHFPHGSRYDVLNLTDTKTSGVMWSGAMNDRDVVIFVSNLSGSGNPVAVPLPRIRGLPSQTPPVADGTHETFVYPRPPRGRERMRSR